MKLSEAKEISRYARTIQHPPVFYGVKLYDPGQMVRFNRGKVTWSVRWTSAGSYGYSYTLRSNASWNTRYLNQGEALALQPLAQE